MQTLKKLLHVAGLAREFGDLKQRALEVFSTLSVRHLLTQRIVELRQFQGAPQHRFFQVSTVQYPVERHGHVPCNNQEQRPVFGAVSARNVVHLHRQHAEHIIRCIFKRRAHPELGQMAYTKESALRLGGADTGGVDQQWLAAGQHMPGQGHVRGIEKFVVLGFQCVDINDVDVIGVGDFAAASIIKREVKILGVDQRRE